MSEALQVVDGGRSDARRREIEMVRQGLAHPPGAIEVDPETGMRRFVKPPKRTALNVRAILTGDSIFAQRLAYNEHSGVVEWQGRPITDADITVIRCRMAEDYALEPTAQLTHELTQHVAMLNGYHPIRDYLDGLAWDGVERVENLLASYAGAEDSDLNRTLSIRFMVSCVARVYRPGCKVDTVLILAGAQGVGKSTFFRALAGHEWFRDTAIDLRNKDAYLSLRGSWIYEMAELAAMRPRDAETVKAFLSAQVDHFRPPYGRNMVTQQRQCVFVGTTNEATFLNDPTGARRFWPVAVERSPDVTATSRDRDQLWAEAVRLFKGNVRWWLELNESDALAEQHQRYQHEDPWDQVIERWTSEPPKEGFTAGDVLRDAIDMPAERQGRHHEMRVGGILQRLGFERKRTTQNGRRAMRWFRS